MAPSDGGPVYGTGLNGQGSKECGLTIRLKKIRKRASKVLMIESINKVK
jgi:hypothetical protein